MSIRLRAPTKLELAGVGVVAIVLWFASRHELHPAGDPWWLWAGVGGLLLFGVGMFVGQPAIDTARAFIGLAGHAKREFRRRSTRIVKPIDPDEPPVNDR